MTLSRQAATSLLPLLLACSPALDWREVRPAGSDAVALFPCKPDRLARQVSLGGAQVEMRLATCTVQETVYAVGYATLAEPSQVTPALEHLRRAAAANIGAAPVASGWSMRGMTPNPLAQKLVMQGRNAQGKPVQEQAVFFVRGLRVYQATVVGETLDSAAVDVFFSGLKLPA